MFCYNCQLMLGKGLQSKIVKRGDGNKNSNRNTVYGFRRLNAHHFAKYEKFPAHFKNDIHGLVPIILEILFRNDPG